jgi:hypothetical protein
MATVAVVLASVALALVGALASVASRRPRKAKELLAGLFVERVVVTIRARPNDRETSFVGLLTAADDRSLILQSAEAVTTSGRKAVDGELLIPRSEVAYIQHLMS